MKRLFRRAKALTAVAAALLLAAGCGVGSSGNSNTLTMTVWTSDARQLSALNDLASRFSSSHNGVHVQIQSIPQNDYLTKLSVRLAGNDAPDLGWMGAPDAVGMSAAGQLVDLTPALQGDQAYRLDDYVQPAFTNWRSNGALYGVPFSTSPFFTIYNKTLFAKAGLPDPGELAARGDWTWTQLADLARRLQPTLPQGSYAFESNEGGMYGPLAWATLDPLVRAFGTSIYDPANGKCLLDTPQATAAVALYRQMTFTDRTAVPPGAQADFYAGRAAVTVTQLSRLSQLKGANFQWGVAALPAGPGAAPAITGQAGLVVFKKSHNQQLATELLKFMTSADATRTLAPYYPPARTSVLADAGRIYANGPLPADAVQNVLVAGISNGQAFQYPAQWSRARTTAQPILDQLWTPQANAPDVLHSLCSALTPVLQGR